jgi:hypothetical protein
MTEESDSFSDTAKLSPHQREIVRLAREDRKRWKDLPAEKRSKLDPRKQDFAIGIRPDGTVNLTDPDAPDDEWAG